MSPQVVFQWFLDNMAWAFSGVGLGALAWWWKSRLPRVPSQCQQGEAASQNIQAGGNVTVTNNPRTPSDLAGVTPLKFEPRSDDNLDAALGGVCTRLTKELQRDHEARSTQGTAIEEEVRPRRRQSLGTASTTVEGEEKRYAIVNISETGALLETDTEIPKGSSLKLEFAFDPRPDNSEATVIAEVVRLQDPSWELPGGVGVEFKAFYPGSETVISKYVLAPGAVYCEDRR